MNYINEICLMLDVNIGEEFIILDEDEKEIALNPFSFTEKYLVNCVVDVAYKEFVFLINGNFKIKDKQLKQLKIEI